MSQQDDLNVWSSMLDGRFTAKVVWTSPYRGELTIADGNKVLYRKPVGLSYNAQFGPGVDDFRRWQQSAIAFVDKLKRS